MATLPVVDSQGTALDGVDASDTIFAAPIQPNVVHEAVVALQAAKRQGTHKSKNRNEVRGGGAKPFRQKGTGRSRRGSTREPGMRTGGDVHGPLPRSYAKEVPVRVRRQALCCVLSERLRGDALRVLDGLSVDSPKTKPVVEMLARVAPNARRTLVITPEHHVNLYLSTRNAPSVTVRTANDVNTLDVLMASQVVVQREALPVIEQRLRSVRFAEEAA